MSVSGLRSNVGQLANISSPYLKDGVGVQQDVTEAAEWFQAAALRGNARAQRELGGLYEVSDTSGLTSCMKHSNRREMVSL